jgi:hypothetical protein
MQIDAAGMPGFLHKKREDRKKRRENSTRFIKPFLMPITTSSEDLHANLVQQKLKANRQGRVFFLLGFKEGFLESKRERERERERRKSVKTSKQQKIHHNTWDWINSKCSP